MSLDSGVNNLLVGLGAATQARTEANLAEQRAHEAEMEAFRVKTAASRNKSDEELRKDAAAAKDKASRLESNNEYLREQLKEKDALILEWMHSNDAFKQLARQYGMKLGVTDEQRREDFQDKVLDLADDDPSYKTSRLTDKVEKIRRPNRQ